MPRKIFICFFVVLLMTTLVVPVFAASSAGSGDLERANVQIDYIQLLDGSNAGALAEWPNNFGLASSDARVDYGFMSFETRVGSTFATYVSPGDSNYVRLFCSDYYWTDNPNLTVSSSGAVFSGVKVSGNIVTAHPGAGSYFLQFSFFSKSLGPYSSELDLDYLIRQAVGNIYDYGSIVYLQDVTFELSFYRSDPGSSITLDFNVAKAGKANQFATWFNTQNLPIQNVTEVIDSPGMFDWLLDSVNAFLNFEIVPELTLNRIFYIVLVIGLLLWFLTLVI